MFIMFGILSIFLNGTNELPIPEGVVLGGIVRDNKLIFSDENTTIFVKDKLILFSDPTSIKEIEKFSEVNIEFF